MPGSSHHSLSFARLKAKQRSIRESFPQNFGLRVHRSISWIGRAENEEQDLDARFLFYWIAFNAAYADERDVRGEREAFAWFSENFASSMRITEFTTLYGQPFPVRSAYSLKTATSLARSGHSRMESRDTKTGNSVSRPQSECSIQLLPNEIRQRSSLCYSTAYTCCGTS